MTSSQARSKPHTSGVNQTLGRPAPVTLPVLHATAPVTTPAVRTIGAEHVVPAVTGHPVTGQPAQPTPRGDTSVTPAVAAPVERITPRLTCAPGTAPAVKVEGPTRRRSGARPPHRFARSENHPPPADLLGTTGCLAAVGEGALRVDVVMPLSSRQWVGRGRVPRRR